MIAVLSRTYLELISYNSVFFEILLKKRAHICDLRRFLDGVNGFLPAGRQVGIPAESKAEFGFPAK